MSSGGEGGSSTQSLWSSFVEFIQKLYTEPFESKSIQEKTLVIVLLLVFAVVVIFVIMMIVMLVRKSLLKATLNKTPTCPPPLSDSDSETSRSIVTAV